MESLWSQTVQMPEFEESPEDMRVETLVIGGGIAGILIAYLLQSKGQQVVVLEAKEIASGQTGNTTAKITSQHGLVYHDMLKNAGVERTRDYANANQDAITKYEEIITKEGIACDFVRIPSFLYTVESKGIEKLKQEAEAAKTVGLPAEYVEGDKITELPFSVAGAVRFDNQAQFHPLKFIQAIAPKLRIYEHTNVLEVDDYIVTTNRGVIVADNIVFATHYPFVNRPGYYFLRQHQSRSYVLALEGKGVPKELSGMYYGIDKGGISLRSAEGKLLFGGSAHRTGKSAKRAPLGYCNLRKKAAKYYPNAKESAHWSAQDCMPHDRIPYIGRFSGKREHWYVATGFGKWGMTSAMVSAMIISDLISGRENLYQYTFSPQRLLIRAGLKNFCVDGAVSAWGLIKGLFAKKERTCPHLGCALTWNEEEESWDCACHGSRFTKDGKLIDNPAQRNLSDSN